ncbi:hypothetical protein [Saccharopolyspora soli]|nr:hypothetical protein [Saccharopolyspora soli]
MSATAQVDHPRKPGQLRLARAVEWHCAGRVIRHGDQTVVFYG